MDKIHNHKDLVHQAKEIQAGYLEVEAYSKIIKQHLLLDNHSLLVLEEGHLHLEHHLHLEECSLLVELHKILEFLEITKMQFNNKIKEDFSDKAVLDLDSLNKILSLKILVI